MKTSWIALIPAYEPSELLLDLLHETRRAGFAAVVVDDGSGTAFTDLFRQAALLAVVLSYPKNRGKGFALKHGLSYIRDHFDGTYIVVTLAAPGFRRCKNLPFFPGISPRPDPWKPQLKKSCPIEKPVRQFGYPAHL